MQAQAKEMHYDGLLAEVWDLGLEMTGIKRGVQAFVRRLPIALPPGAQIYEVGCGTGVVSIALARKYPHAHVLATDLETDMLRKATRYVAEAGVSDRITFARANAQEPHRVDYRTGAASLKPDSFDLVVASAVLEHTDVTESIPALVELTKPGGYILDISMNGANIVGRAVGVVFKFEPFSAHYLCDLFRENGCEARIVRFSWKEVPANLTRVGILARRKRS